MPSANFLLDEIAIIISVFKNNRTIFQYSLKNSVNKLWK